MEAQPSINNQIRQDGQPAQNHSLPQSLSSSEQRYSLIQSHLNIHANHSHSKPLKELEGQIGRSESEASNTPQLVFFTELKVRPGRGITVFQIDGSGHHTEVVKSPIENEIFQDVVTKREGQRIELNNLNCITVGKNGQLHNLLSDADLERPTLAAASAASKAKKIICKCRRSKCQKLYCECFANETSCGDGCSCTGCQNFPANAKALLSIRQDISNRRTTEEKGCKCQRSKCGKKYCDCFNRGFECGPYCSCVDCGNKGDITKLQDHQKIV